MRWIQGLVTAWISAILLIAILSIAVLLPGCNPKTENIEPKNIDYLLEMDKLGVPTSELAFKQLDTEVRDIKLDTEVRRAIGYPRQGVILVRIPMVVEGGKFTCAVASVTATNSSVDCWFTFTRLAPSGVGEELDSVWVQESELATWHYEEIDLSEYAGRSITIAIESSTKSAEYINYLANPRYEIPQESEPKRMILICIDTLRAGSVGAYGEGSTLTPVLDQFANDSIRFANCQSASTWTFPACAAISTGRFPGLIGASGVTENLRPEEMTLAELFFNAGYRTTAIINNTYVSDGVGMFQGFEYMRHIPKQAADLQFANSLEWINQHIGEDFYLYIHLFDPHVPYAPPEPYLSQYRQGSGRFETEFDSPNEVRDGSIVLTDEEKLQLRGLYNGEVAFSDTELGKFFDQLKALGIYDNTSIVIFADHGEEFWDHGGFEHGHSVYQEVTHVPLFMKLPGVEPSVYEHRMSLVDVLPTWLGWAGLEYPENVSGRNLLNNPTNLDTRSMFIEDCIHATDRRAVIQGDWKQILYFDGQHDPELYNLADDPYEKNNLFLSRADIGTPLTTELLMYSMQTSEGCHVRMYNFEGYSAPQKYQLTVTTRGGQFSDIVNSSEGVVVENTLDPNMIVAQVEFGAGGYISLDFNVTPENAEITFTAEFLDEPDKDFDWYLGASGTPTVGKGVALTMLDDSVAMSFPQAQLTNSHGVYIWSIPPSVKSELANSLTPEQRAELDALGYIH